MLSTAIFIEHLVATSNIIVNMKPIWSLTVQSDWLSSRLVLDINENGNSSCMLQTAQQKHSSKIECLVLITILQACTIL